MNYVDIRWKQRFSNYQKALAQLNEFLSLQNPSKFENQGLIKAFEYTYELAWNTIKDFYEYQGESNIQGSRDAIRLAFKRGLIQDGETWMNMIQSRIDTSHTYNESTAQKVIDDIYKLYIPLFNSLEIEFKNL